MFKKGLILGAILAMTTTNAYCGVPIFSSTESADEYFQQMDLTPTNSKASAYASEATPSSAYVVTPMPSAKPVAYASEVTPSPAYETPAQGVSTLETRSEFLDFVKISNDNFQNAIQNLEGAEVGIREQLINYKTQYNDANTRYSVIKAERDTLKKQVRAYEKKIKEIERTKKQISKNIVGA